MFAYAFAVSSSENIGVFFLVMIQEMNRKEIRSRIGSDATEGRDGDATRTRMCHQRARGCNGEHDSRVVFSFGCLLKCTCFYSLIHAKRVKLSVFVCVSVCNVEMCNMVFSKVVFFYTRISAVSVRGVSDGKKHYMYYISVGKELGAGRSLVILLGLGGGR